MKIVRHTAPDMRQALRSIREQLGEDAPASAKPRTSSLLKSMWPGESIKLIRYSFGIGATSGAGRLIMEKYSEIADDSMVIPRSCSSGRESR